MMANSLKKMRIDDEKEQVGRAASQAGEIQH